MSSSAATSLSPIAPHRRRDHRIGSRLPRWLRPPRTLRPTRAGWVFFALTLGVGFGALNSGNNLLYLVFSLMLAFLVLSGVLSESALRRIEVRRRLPKELFAGAPATLAVEITNTSLHVPAFAIAVEDLLQPRAGVESFKPLGRMFALRVAPGATELRAYRLLPPRRGPLRLAGFRVSTRFPFGLFAKACILEHPEDALAYPAIDARRRSRRPAHEPWRCARAGSRAPRAGARSWACGPSRPATRCGASTGVRRCGAARRSCARARSRAPRRRRSTCATGGARRRSGLRAQRPPGRFAGRRPARCRGARVASHRRHLDPARAGAPTARAPAGLPGPRAAEGGGLVSRREFRSGLEVAAPGVGLPAGGAGEPHPGRHRTDRAAQPGAAGRRAGRRLRAASQAARLAAAGPCG